MGNTIQLLSETEEIEIKLSDFYITEPLCLHQQNKGRMVYDVYGSGRREIKEYAYVWFNNRDYVSKLECDVVIISNEPISFINVRKSKIIRKYNNDYIDISNDKIVGEFNGKFYDITGIYSN